MQTTQSKPVIIKPEIPPQTLARLYQIYFGDEACLPQKILNNLLFYANEGHADSAEINDILSLLTFFEDLFAPITERRVRQAEDFDAPGAKAA